MRAPLTSVRELRYLVLALQREGNRLFAAGLRPLGLTPAQAESLTVLAAFQPLSLRELGELLICESGSSPSRVVDRLVTSGIVRRETDPGDHRSVLLSLTTEGRKLARRVSTVESDVELALDQLVAGHDTAPAVALLRSMAARLPAGEALRNRGLLAES